MRLFKTASIWGTVLSLGVALLELCARINENRLQYLFKGFFFKHCSYYTHFFNYYHLVVVSLLSLLYPFRWSWPSNTSCLCLRDVKIFNAATIKAKTALWWYVRFVLTAAVAVGTMRSWRTQAARKKTSEENGMLWTSRERYLSWWALPEWEKKSFCECPLLASDPVAGW